MTVSRIQTTLRYVGANVRRLREERGWTQDDLADKLGIARKTLVRMETGENSTLETLIAVAGAFRVEPAALFAEADWEKRKAGRPKPEK